MIQRSRMEMASTAEESQRIRLPDMNACAGESERCQYECRFSHLNNYLRQMSTYLHQRTIPPQPTTHSSSLRSTHPPSHPSSAISTPPNLISTPSPPCPSPAPSRLTLRSAERHKPQHWQPETPANTTNSSSPHSSQSTTSKAYITYTLP